MNWRKPLIYGLLYGTGSNIPKYLKEIQRVDKLPLEEKERYQKEKLRKLLLHAYNNVPYYHDVLGKTKVVVDGKVHLENFSKIPILTKDIIRKQGKNLYSKDYKKRKPYENTSGGSTGEPVRFIQDKEYDEWNIATKIYFARTLGKHEGDAELKLWGSDRDIIKGNLTIKERIINFLYNRRFFNCYNFGEADMNKLARINNEFRPVSYWAYVDAITEFSKYVLKNNIKLRSPKYIISTIGPLYPESKRIIEKAFNCPVYNQYGSREVGWVAFEHKESLKICIWRQFVELASKENKMVITSLDNFSMPLIRYEIGDVATKGANYKLGESVSYLTIGNVLGRTLGFFKLADGTLKHTHFIVQQLFFRDWIKKFQIIQKDHDNILIKVVGEKNKKEMDDINSLLLGFLGKKFSIKWDFVSEINHLPNGKFLYTICEAK